TNCIAYQRQETDPIAIAYSSPSACTNGVPQLSFDFLNVAGLPTFVDRSFGWRIEPEYGDIPLAGCYVRYGSLADIPHAHWACLLSGRKRTSLRRLLKVRYVPIADIWGSGCRLLGFQPMPTYQYRCDKCGKKFERNETISEHEAMKNRNAQVREQE